MTAGRPAVEAPRTTAPGSDRCPRCDATFGCGVDSGACWCAQAKLTAEHLGQLAGEYDGCLCPSCLRELQQAQPGAAPLH